MLSVSVTIWLVSFSVLIEFLVLIAFASVKVFVKMSKQHRRRKSKSSKYKSPFSSVEIDDLDNNEDGFLECIHEIKVSKTIGRYMVAKRNIKAGSIIIRENPLVVGPCLGGNVQCIGCYKDVEKQTRNICTQCGWPMCCTDCPGKDTQFGHTRVECSVLKECRSSDYFNWDDVESMRMNFHSIVPLRCLLLKGSDPSAYQTLMDMENHNDIRRNIPEVWQRNQTTVVEKILKEWKLTEYTEDEIHTICGILEVNAFEIGHQGISVRGVYPTAFLMSHDCVPNTNHSDDGANFTLTVRASLDIPANFPITLSYAYTLQNTIRRREHLLENKFFNCFCKRCSDPTELGTYGSALICPKCKNGYVLSDDPLNVDSKWSCVNGSQNELNNCPGYTISSRSVKLLIDRINQDYDKINCNDINSMEQFLKKYRNVLHPNHYICLAVKLSLSQLYGKIDGYLIYEMSDELLSRKIEICKEILEIFNIIEPGLTKLRGVTLYELHAPLMVLMTRQFERGVLSKYEIKVKLKEVITCLVEARNILEMEPKISAEGAMGIAASEALLQIKDWEKIIGRI